MAAGEHEIETAPGRPEDNSKVQPRSAFKVVAVEPADRQSGVRVWRTLFPLEILQGTLDPRMVGVPERLE